MAPATLAVPAASGPRQVVAPPGAHLVAPVLATRDLVGRSREGLAGADARPRGERMDVLDLLWGKLALQRRVLDEATLRQGYAEGRATGQGLGDVLIRRGLVSPALVTALRDEAGRADVVCVRCGRVHAVGQLDPQRPFSCAACDGPLEVRARPSGDGNTATAAGADSWRVPAQRSGGHGSDSRSTTRPGGEIPELAAFSGTSSARVRALLRPGSTAGDYEIADELGRGAMGVVFRARHRTSGRDVAIKILLPGAAEGRRLKRFEREAQTLARLDHVNIVRILDSGFLAGHPFFAMELVDGRPLAELIREGVDVERAVELAHGVAQGLQHAHERGAIHRDVKPDNILVDRAGIARLTDFGLVRDLELDQSRLTRSGAVVGTPYYMSPEQARGQGHAITGATDVYSLGVVLYQLLTGELPFEADTYYELSRKVLDQAPAPPSRANHLLPPDLDAVVLKALAKAPEARYGTAGDMADDLARFLAGERVLARSPRRLGGAALGVGVGLAAALALVGGLLASSGGGAPEVAAPGETALLPDGAPTDPDEDGGEETGAGPGRIDGTGVAAGPATDDPREAALAAVRAVDEAFAQAPQASSPPAYRAALQRAEAAASDALVRVGDDARLLVRRGWARVRLNRPDDADADLRRAIALDPRGPFGAEAAFQLARLDLQRAPGEREALRRIRRWQEELGFRSEGALAAAEPWPSLFTSVNEVAEGLELDGSLARIRAVRSRHAEVAEVWGVLALVHLRRMEPGEALGALEDALHLDPWDAGYWAMRANLDLLFRDDPDRAIRSIDRALDLAPGHPRALELRGTMRGQRGDLAGAVADFEQVLEGTPASEVALMNLTHIYLMRDELALCDALLARSEAAMPARPSPYLLAAEVALGLLDLDRAMAALSRGLTRITDREDRRLLERPFQRLYVQGLRWQQARELAQRLLARDPGDIFALGLLAHVAFLAGDLDAALAGLDDSMREHPESLELRELRVRMLADAGGPGTFEEGLEQLLVAGRSDPGVLAYVARCLTMLDQVPRARELALDAARRGPSSAESWRVLAAVELASGRLEQARSHMRRALALAPRDPENYLVQARVLSASGDDDGAIAAGRQSLSGDPFGLEAPRELGELYRRARRYEDMLRLFGTHEKAMSSVGRGPSSTMVLHLLHGVIGLGREDDAQGLANQIVEAGPMPLPDRTYLAEGLAELGRPTEARALVEQVLKVWPDDERARRLLERLPPP